MKILLLNDNPVVTKLVTLSAQKTNDEVVAMHSIEEVPVGQYDLLIIDDALYNEEAYATLKEKVTFKKSLYICSRENGGKGEFSATIKKPFLPTDMVELLSTTKQNLDRVQEGVDENLLEDLELEGLEDFGSLDGFEENLDSLNDKEIENIESDLDLDMDFDSELENDLESDLDIDLDALDGGVLDDEDAQQVKDLLDDTEPDFSLELEDEEKDEDKFEDEFEDMSLEDEVDLDIDSLELDSEGSSDALEEMGDEMEDFSFEEGDTLEENIESQEELEPEEDLGFEEEMEPMQDSELQEQEEIDPLEDDLEEEESFEPEAVESQEEEEPQEEVLQEEEEAQEDGMPQEEEESQDESSFEEEIEEPEESIESQIESAVGELSDEDLESEVDKETLVDIANKEINSFDNLSSADLKAALGEELESSQEEEEAVEEEQDFQEPESSEESNASTQSGVASLKALLKTLSDENVAASLKGAKITINISFEDA